MIIDFESIRFIEINRFELNFSIWKFNFYVSQSARREQMIGQATYTMLLKALIAKQRKQMFIFNFAFVLVFWHTAMHFNCKTPSSATWFCSYSNSVYLFIISYCVYNILKWRRCHWTAPLRACMQNCSFEIVAIQCNSHLRVSFGYRFSKRQCCWWDELRIKLLSLNNLFVNQK